jgi:tetratricopeptide (TPR) repeat protein
VGWRFRKSVRLGPGVRLNLGKSGFGVSTGMRGLRYSVHSSGRRTVSTGIPGTGLSFVSTQTAGGRPRAASAKRTTPTEVVRTQPSAGLFAPGYEKEFAKGIRALQSGGLRSAVSHFEKSSANDQHNRVVTDDLFAGVLLLKSSDYAKAIPHLERVVASSESLPDKLMKKYVSPDDQVAVTVTSELTVQLPWSSLSATVALAEAYQHVGRNEEAIGLLQQVAELDREPIWRLSLAELLAESKEWTEVVEVAAGIENDDDVSLQIKLLQASALHAMGLTEAAIDTYAACLRSRKRSAELLILARYSRGVLLLKLGKRSQALRDLGKVYAQDPGYRDVAQLVTPAVSSVEA